MSMDVNKTRTPEGWSNWLESVAEGGEHEPADGDGDERQWHQFRRPDGALELVGPGMTPTEGAVPTHSHQP